MSLGIETALNAMGSFSQPLAPTQQATADEGTSDFGTSSFGTSSFGTYMKQAIDNVNGLQFTANALAEEVTAGNPEHAHRAMVAMEHSLMALDFTLQMRNKVLDAYQEIIRMQI